MTGTRILCSNIHICIRNFKIIEKFNISLKTHTFPPTGQGPRPGAGGGGRFVLLATASRVPNIQLCLGQGE